MPKSQRKICQKASFRLRNEKNHPVLRKCKKYSENSLTFNFVSGIVNEINEKIIR